ncbi:B3/4 domain-containing protein [Klebsiella pneumoniae subsp. pneumoniae]|nr:B3/4 domain-containing protein [Klebsiella pneumoniae subsp. pneumoniae]
MVDVTNYVLLELGQPMHAFDRDRIEGGIVVRMAKEGKPWSCSMALKQSSTATRWSLQTITKRWRWGIFGGEHSGVNDETQNVLLECAFFSPLSITGRAPSWPAHRCLSPL